MHLNNLVIEMLMSNWALTWVKSPKYGEFMRENVRKAWRVMTWREWCMECMWCMKLALY